MGGLPGQGRRSQVPHAAEMRSVAGLQKAGEVPGVSGNETPTVNLPVTEATTPNEEFEILTSKLSSAPKFVLSLISPFERVELTVEFHIPG